MIKEILTEINEKKFYYSWVGGSDDYKSIKTIKQLISEYKWDANRIDNGGDHRRAVQNNKDIWKKLEALGVTAIADESDKIPADGFKGVKDIDIKKVEQ